MKSGGGGGSTGGGGTIGGGNPDNPGPGGVSNSIRYQAIPDTSIGNDKIKYSYTYDGYDFYYIYLGELRNIPLFYDDAQRHLWNYSSSTYTWSTASATETTVSSAVTRTSQETVSVTNQHTVEKTTELNFHEEVSAKFKIFGIGTDVKFSADQKFKEFTSDTTTTGYQRTTSLTDTVAFAKSQTDSLKRERSFTLTKSDKEGYYRYTYFSASDVYLYVVRNPKANEIYYEFREYVVPVNNFWDMDYCETPDFKKSDSTRFTIDTSILNNLPATQKKFDSSGPTPTGPVEPVIPVIPVFTVRNNSEWEAALSVIKSGGNGKKYTITVSGNVLVTGRTTATFGTVSNVEVTLNGNGELYLGSQGRLLTIDSSQTVIIDSPSLIIKGLRFGNGGVNNNDSMVRVNAGGKLELKSGNIQDNTNYSYTAVGGGSGSNSNFGGGVYVAGSFTMSGGYISGNDCTSYCDDVSGKSSTSVYSKGFGGGVYVAGGGSFTMTAGNIEKNQVVGWSPSRYGYAHSFTNGGGVHVDGSFTMSGGTIEGNVSHAAASDDSDGGGGGVGVGDGSFTMTAGTISGNTVTADGQNSRNNIATGGGVKAYGNFSKTGGTIFGNDAMSSLKNTIYGKSVNGYAVYCVINGAWYYRNATADTGVYLSSSSTSNWNK